jgi:hypothetical protein
LISSSFSFFFETLQNQRSSWLLLFPAFSTTLKEPMVLYKRAFDHFIKFLTTAIVYQNGFSNVWELWFKKVYKNWLFTDLYISEPQKTNKKHLNMVEKRLSKC